MLTGNEILIKLNEQQLSFTDIAKLLDCTPQHVWAVARRTRCSSRVAKALSVAIGVPLSVAFSDQPQYLGTPDPATKQRRVASARVALQKAGVL